MSDSPTVSGAEHVLLSHIRALRENDRAAFVYYRASNERLARELERCGAVAYPTRSFSDYVVRTTWRPDHLAHFATRFRRVFTELVDLIKREHIDVIHTVMYPAALYVAFAARATRVPQIWHEHGIKRIHRINRQLYRFAASSCSFVIGPSDAVTGALAGAGIEPSVLRTVYNGIDLERFRTAADEIPRTRASLGLADGQPTIALFGQLLPHKGHHLLIAAAPAILRACPDARFCVVGALENPEYEAELKAELVAQGLSDRFVFTGWRSDVPALMAAVDVVVVPTLTPEPAALSLMEAMALGRPLVASATGGTSELVVDGSTGLLFPPGRADILAQRVIEALAQPELAAQLGTAGRQRMEQHFSEARHLQEIASLYSESVARWSGRRRTG